MSELRLGVVGTSSKENEYRLPIHPAHLDRIDERLRARIVLEQGYGRRFGVSDAQLAAQVSAMLPRQEVIDASDIVLLPKPTLDDLELMNPGQTLWGWPHAVQDRDVTQLAIDKKLTLIAWEAMNHWTPGGDFMVHVFHMNNEMAGYCSVLHAMALIGTTGHYGRQLRAAVLGFGNTARGAINALNALGISEVTALTMRGITTVASPIPGVELDHMHSRAGSILVRSEGREVPVAAFLAGFDVIVNCVLQDTDAPMMFVVDGELDQFVTGTLIVDVSCDAGMGFEFARPTSFEEPMCTVGDGVAYYAVDHSPSYLWNSATWGISEALIPFIPTVMAGPQAWAADETISRAVEIHDGVVQNNKIVSFQRRASEYPHPVLGA